MDINKMLYGEKLPEGNLVLLQSSLDLLRDQVRCIFWEKLNGASNMALEFDDPAEFINEFPWGFSPKEDVSSEEIRRMNANFSLNSSFGRAVLAVSLVEKFFPENSIRVAEVVQDERAQKALDKLNKKDFKDPDSRTRVAKELLVFENTRIVVIINDKQFDPSTCVVSDIKHPDSMTYEPWPAFKVCQIVDMALGTGDLDDRISYLEKARFYCPGMMMVKENLAIAAALLGDDMEQVFQDIARVRPSARLFYAAWFAYSATDITKKYPKEVLELLNDEHDDRCKERFVVPLYTADGFPGAH